MRCTFQFAPVKVIGRVERDADALFREQQPGDFLPCFAPLALLADEIEVRFQDAVKRPASAFGLRCFSHIASQNNSGAGIHGKE